MQSLFRHLYDLSMSLALSFVVTAAPLFLGYLVILYLEPTRELAFVHDWAADVRSAIIIFSILAATFVARFHQRKRILPPRLLGCGHHGAANVAAQIGADKNDLRAVESVILFLLIAVGTNILSLIIINNNTYGCCDIGL